MNLVSTRDASSLVSRPFIDGAWLAHGNHGEIPVENPANEQVIASIPDCTADDADAAVAAAKTAFAEWSAKPAIERAGYVHALADGMAQDKERLAGIVTAEQGKPLAQARGEIDAAVTFLRFAAEQARRITGEIIQSDARREDIHIRRHPYGVVVGLTAWNYPAALAARKLGPALVAGNTFVLLSHENTPLSGLAIADLAERIGLPKGVFNVLTGRGAVVGQRLVEHPDTDLVTMTGSTRAGREIFRTAADRLKVIRLELGGKAPFIVMEDADIDAAVDAAVTARFTNCGQICTCNERMYLHASIADTFLDKFVSAARSLTIGDPMQDVDMGPKISAAEVDKVADITAQGIAAGAEVLLDGGPLSGGAFDAGHWYAPTVLEVHDNDNPLLQAEVFGPVVAAKRVADFDEAVACANDTDFGLSAYLFTQNAKRLSEAPHRLRFGELYLNRSNGEAVQGFHTGWGMSGLGGEDGTHGFSGYLRKQTAYLNWG
ncbi:MAG: aldehyde dehydrogenase family protein [Pseudomonadota bacterium]